MYAKKKLLLLVEDNDSDVCLALRAFRRSSVAPDIVVAEDGQEALDLLFSTGAHAGQAEGLHPAAVVLDLKLPRVDGIEVLRHLRLDKRTRSLPVIVLTSSNETTDVARCYDLGANSYLRKPIDFNQFVELIEYITTYWLRLNELPPEH